MRLIREPWRGGDSCTYSTSSALQRLNTLRHVVLRIVDERTHGISHQSSRGIRPQHLLQFRGVVETWFEPGKEIIVIHDKDEAVERYRWLLGHDAERRAIGSAARERVLREHTFRHRARQLVEIVKNTL